MSRSTPTLLQPALKVGAANDPLEREAETTAERIVSMPSPELAPPAADPSSGGQGRGGLGAAQRASVDDQPDLDTLETAPPIPADHQDPDVPKEEDVDTTGLVADDMQEIESGAPEDTAGEPPAEEAPPPSDEEPTAQPARSGDAAVVGAEGGAAPADVARRVSQPGSGRALPTTVRAFMEPRFGKDFSDVRVHDAADDRTAARRIGARAFTHRQHIWLGPGESVENRRLIAHELTHVVQQTKRSPVPLIKRKVDPSEETGEPQVRRGAIANKLEKYARNVPGYRLVSVILGKSPITGNRVTRNATNLLGALLGMLGPAGNLLFKKLQETRIIQDAFEWVSKRLSDLNITWTRIKGLISDLYDYLPDWPSDVIRYAKSRFAPIVRDILTFIGEVKDKILEFIIRGALKLAGPLAEKVWGVIKKAGNVISTILDDPLGFAKNLFRSVLTGFRQFGSNIWKHIKKGLLGWLFGAIQGLDIQIPEKLDFKGLISIGLQIVGLTYANFRAKLVKRLGANGERKVAYLEKSVEVVKILVKEGFVGLWQRVLQMIDNFKTTIIGGIRDFVIKSLIMGGLSWLAKLSNPVGAIVGVVLAIYKLIKTFLERLDQILDVANSIFSSIGAIASGKIQQAANFIENTIAATIPVVISFLAVLVPISGITNSIRGIIKKLQTPVKMAMDKMITFLVKKAKKLFSKIIGKLNRKRKLPSANFKVGKVQHRIYAEKKGKSVQVMVASGKGRPIDDIKALQKVEQEKVKDAQAQKKAKEISGETEEADKETEGVAKKVKLSSKNINQNNPLKNLEAEIKEAATELGQGGQGIDAIPELSEDDAVALFRSIDPRDAGIEGKVGTHKEMKALTVQNFPGSKRRKSDYYEVDHTIEKRFPKAIVENLNVLDKSQRQDGQPPEIFRTRDRESLRQDREGGDIGKKTATQSEKGKPFGALGKDKRYLNISDEAPQFPGMIVFHKLHAKNKSKDKSSAHQVVEAAAKTEDPHQTLRKRLTKQLADELSEITAIYSSDTTAPEKIKKNVSKGAKQLQKLNKEIYGLTKTGAPPKAHKKEKRGAKAAANATFSPDAGDAAKRPNFQRDEGVGQAHGNFAKGFGDFLEYDHIIDKAYPDRVKGLTLGVGPFSGNVSKKATESRARKASRTRDTAKAKRLEKLKAEPVFRGTSLADYEGKTGYAVAISRPIAKIVTRNIGMGLTSAVNFVEEIPDRPVEAGAKYVQKGKKSDLKEASRLVRESIKPKFLDRTDKHAGAVADEYANEIKKVALINPGKERQAKQAMTHIAQRVATSLRTARTETTGLFS